MSKMILFTVVVLAYLTSVHAHNMSSADIATVLSMHNNLRSSVSPAAADMREMLWSDELAASALAYVSTCPGGHSNTDFGENMSWGFATLSLDYGIQMWINEAAYYTFSTDFTCRKGECGHYTQMVWANSEYVGCAMKLCPNMIAGFTSPTAGVLVCQYKNAGNYVGQYPYISGATCSKCPTGYGCKAGLCTKPVAAPTPAPTTMSRRLTPAVTTAAATTAAPTTAAPTTAAPTTVAPTTAAPTTAAPTTAAPTTAAPTTVAPTTAAPTTINPRRTGAPTAETPTTPAPTTPAPTTAAPTTAAPTTAAPTTAAPTTAAPTTINPRRTGAPTLGAVANTVNTTAIIIN